VLVSGSGYCIGTFHQRALYEVVYRREVEQLVELAKHPETKIPPVEALRRWLQAGVEFMATKEGMRQRSPWPRTVPRSLWSIRSTG
jgi:hypothetical protein